MNEENSKELENRINTNIENIQEDLNNFVTQLDGNFSLSTPNIIPHIESKEEYEQIRQNFMKEFTEYDPMFNPSFLKDKINESKLPKSSNTNTIIAEFYQNEIEKLKTKENIISNRILQSGKIENYLNSFTSFMKSNSSLIEKYQTSLFRCSPSLQPNNNDIMHYFQSMVHDTKMNWPLDYLFTTFKLYSFSSHERILNKLINRLRSDLSFVLNLSIPKSQDVLEKEIERFSAFCGIPVDLEIHDGQEFLYHCEKEFTDAFLTKIPFNYSNLGKTEVPFGKKPIDLINNMVVNSTGIESGLNELLESLFSNDIENTRKFYHEEIFRFNIKKEVNHDHLISFMKLRFVKNKKTLILLFDLYTKFEQLRSKFNQVEIAPSVMIMQNLRYVFAFASRTISKMFGDIDKNMIIESTLELLLRYEQAKEKVINILLTIYNHTNENVVINLIVELISKKPNLYYEPLKSYIKQFELNIDLMEMISKCLQSLTDLQILFEQLTESCEFDNKREFLISGDSYPLSYFDVYPRLKKILDFYQTAPFLAEEMCESMMIDYNRYELYMSYSIWLNLFEDIQKFTFSCPPPFEITMLPFINNDNLNLFANELYDNLPNILNETDQITKNFWRLNTFLTKMRHFVYIQEILKSVYEKQLNTKLNLKSLEIPQINLSFLNDNDFDSKIDSIYENTSEFTKMLIVAVRFNNFQADSLFIRNNFDIQKSLTDFSIQPYEDVIKYSLNEYLASVLFNQIEDHLNDKPLCDISKDPSYSKYITLLEIGFLSSLENVFFTFNPVRQYFNFSTTYYSPKTDKISPFIIPTVSQSLNIPDTKINTVHNLIIHRMRICHLIRFESSIPFQFNQLFQSYANSKLSWNGEMIEHLQNQIRQYPLIDPISSIVAFEYLLLYRLFFAVFMTVIDFCLNNSEQPLLIENIKDMAIQMNNQRKSSNNKYMTKNRYIPEWTSLFMANLNETVKFQVSSNIEKVDNDLSEKLTKDPSNQSLDIVQSLFDDLLSKLARFSLNLKEDLKELTVENALKKISQSGLIEIDSSSSESFFTPKRTRIERLHDIESIYILVLHKQLQQLSKLKDYIFIKMTRNSVSMSMLKPEFYTPKKKLMKQQLYIPNPTEVTRQFTFEINYRFSKLIQKLKDFTLIKDITKEKMIELCKTVSPYISLNDNYANSIQSKARAPKQHSDIERTCSAFDSYIRNALSENIANKETISLLSQLLRVEEEDKLSQLNEKCSDEFTDDFMKLHTLRDEYETQNTIHKEIDLHVTETIRKDYEDLLNDLERLIIEEKEKFTRYHNNLYSNVTNSITKHIRHDENEDDSLKKISSENTIDIEEDNIEKLTQNDNAINQIEYEIPKEEENFTGHVSFNINTLSHELLNNDESLPAENTSNSQVTNEASYPVKNENEELSSVNNQQEISSNITNENEILCNDNNQYEAVSDVNNDIFSNASNQNDEFTFENANSRQNTEEMPKFNPSLDDQPRFIPQRVAFSPDTSRRSNRIEVDNDDNQECRRSRPPSSTAGFLLANNTGSRPISPTPTKNERKPEITHFPSPPTTIRKGSTNPKTRRSVHNAIFAHYVRQSQVTKVEDEMDRLRKEILKIRVVHCLNQFAMERYFNAKIAMASQECRAINTVIWNAKRAYEVDIRSIKQKIDECHTQLIDYEAEVESNKEKLEQVKQETVQLVHWKHMNLQMCDRIQNQLKNFFTDKTIDIDVATLVKNIEEARAELDILIMETDALDEQFDREIREPMMAVDFYRRKIQKTRIETAEIQYGKAQKPNEIESQVNEEEDAYQSFIGILDASQALTNDESETNPNPEESIQVEEDKNEVKETTEVVETTNLKKKQKDLEELHKYLEQNKKLLEQNEQIKQTILKLEQQKAQLTPELRESIEQLTSEPQQMQSNTFTPKPIISQSNERKIIKPNTTRKTAQQPLKLSVKWT